MLVYCQTTETFSAILEHEWVASHPEIQKQGKTAWLIQ